MLKGGSHLSNDQTVFSFELNESLFFEKGQEVAEMRGISLDPEISIQAFNEYISIRGVIELRGEYQRVSTTEEEQIMDFEDYPSKRFVEKVIGTEDNGAEFTHRFPVEISVPTYRVADLNDVTVSIESFDYEMPETSQLKLYSTIEIHGINKEIEAPRSEVDTVVKEEPEAVNDLDEEPETMNELESEPEAVNEPEAQPEAVNERKDEVERNDQEMDNAKKEREIGEIGDTFQFEIKEKQVKESVDEAELIHTDNPPPPLPPETEEVTADPDRWKYKQSQTLEEFFKKLPSHESDAAVPEIIETSSMESDIAVSTEVDESRESSSESVEDVRYLSDMFRNSEEHQYTQMRLCIVQNQDTIETIAERYHIPALQLIKQNRLDEDYSVTEGQLLYIPDQKK